MDPRALDAEQHPQVDGGPARRRLAAVAAQLIAGEALHPLQQALPAGSGAPVGPLSALPGLAGRVDAAGGGRRRPVQTLQGGERGRGGRSGRDAGQVRTQGKNEGTELRDFLLFFDSNTVKWHVRTSM